MTKRRIIVLLVICLAGITSSCTHSKISSSADIRVTVEGFVSKSGVHSVPSTATVLEVIRQAGVWEGHLGGEPRIDQHYLITIVRSPDGSPPERFELRSWDLHKPKGLAFRLLTGDKITVNRIWF